MNYHIYKFTLFEYILYTTIYFSFTGLVSYLFYRSLFPFVIFFVGIFPYFKYLRQILKTRRNRILSTQFKDLINAISSLLSTGYSFENAIVESRKEIHSIHGNSLILAELDLICQKLHLHINPEDIFKDFADRTDIDTIHIFSDILTIAKRNGGNLIQVITSTSSSISTQISIEREIDTAISGKRYELYIMAIMPFLIMLYIKLTQPAFFNCVYDSLIGNLIMTVCLCIYLCAIYIANKILSFKH